MPKLAQTVQTEEATKMALVVPVLQALGYDVFDPFEVVPEFTADVGTKKGEKVDYAIVRDDTPIIPVECKSAGVPLDGHAAQLYRYFSVVDARIGMLTNGVEYRLYSDIDQPNKMDGKPFLVLDMLDLQESAVEEFKKIGKASFDLDQILSSASNLKYTTEIKKLLAAELASPSDEFVRHFASQVYPGNVTLGPVRQQQPKAHLPLLVRRKKKYFATYDADRNESRAEIESLKGIYDHAASLRARVEGLLE